MRPPTSWSTVRRRTRRLRAQGQKAFIRYADRTASALTRLAGAVTPGWATRGAATRRKGRRVG